MKNNTTAGIDDTLPKLINGNGKTMLEHLQILLVNEKPRGIEQVPNSITTSKGDKNDQEKLQSHITTMTDPQLLTKITIN